MTPGFRATGLAVLISLAAGVASAEPSTEPAPDAAEPPARPDPTREECLNAHRKAQELKQSRSFVETQEHLSICSSATCPGAVISDCGSWIGELEQITPSMVFEILLDGKEALGAKVFVDGQPIADRTVAVKTNPGRHTVRVELPPFEPHEQSVVLAEGQRMRQISVAFESEKPAAPVAPAVAPPPPKETARPTPFVVYPLLGLGVVGLGGFGVFSMLGKSEQRELEDQCEPTCTDGDLRSMKRMYLIGDVSAGVGAAALVTAAVVYFTRPTEEVATISVGRVGFGAAGDSFGISASRAW